MPSALAHSCSNCDGLAILSERLSKEELEDLGGEILIRPGKGGGLVRLGGEYQGISEPEAAAKRCLPLLFPNSTAPGQCLLLVLSSDCRLWNGPTRHLL